MIRTILAALALCFWSHCAAAQTAPGPRPAIWLLADGDTRIYLFGTFHILPANFRWRSPRFDQIARDADELVLETTEAELARNLEAVRRHLVLGKQASALWRVSPDRREALREIIAASGVPADTLDGLQTWAVVMALGAGGVAQAFGGEPGRAPDLSAMPGVEDIIEAEFIASGRPVSGVEEPAEQLGHLSRMPFAEQRGLLESVVDAYRSAREARATAAFDQHVRWAAGDVEPIAESMREMPTALYDALIIRRNRAWTDWLIRRLERPGNVLFAVGSGHLAGPHSVQAMLAARGVQVSRVGD